MISRRKVRLKVTVFTLIIIENIEIHLRIEDLKGIFNNLKNSYM